MKIQFMPPYMPSSQTVGGWNYRHYGVMDWCDDCCYPYSNVSKNCFNPLRQYWSNHYDAFKELYKKLYEKGFVCTNQMLALHQVLKEPASKIVFTYERYRCFHRHWKPKICLTTKLGITSNSTIASPIWGDVKLQGPIRILRNFISKVENYSSKRKHLEGECYDMCSSKLDQAIQKAKAAEKNAKQAEQLVKKYKGEDKYLVLVAYDCLWPHTKSDSYDFIVVLKHTYATAKSEFSLGQETFNDIVYRHYHCLNTGYEDCTEWLTKEDANRVVSALKRGSHNMNHPSILTLKQFKEDFYLYD